MFSTRKLIADNSQVDHLHKTKQYFQTLYHSQSPPTGWRLGGNISFIRNYLPFLAFALNLLSEIL